MYAYVHKLTLTKTIPAFENVSKPFSPDSILRTISEVACAEYFGIVPNIVMKVHR
jgi:hypothetical protein